jgi:hypothetical protein
MRQATIACASPGTVLAAGRARPFRKLTAIAAIVPSWAAGTVAGSDENGKTIIRMEEKRE